MVAVPTAKLSVWGPDRWRLSQFTLNMENDYKFNFIVPAGFADGTESEVEIASSGGHVKCSETYCV